MRSIYIPDIAETDYARVRKLLREQVPGTCAEWRTLAARLRNNAIARGKAVFSVSVDVDEFSRYVAETRNGADAAGLKRLRSVLRAGHDSWPILTERGQEKRNQ